MSTRTEDLALEQHAAREHDERAKAAWARKDYATFAREDREAAAARARAIELELEDGEGPTGVAAFLSGRYA